MRCLAVLHPPCPGIIGSSKPRFLPLHHLLRRRAKGSLGLRRRAPLKGTRVAVSSKPPPSPVSDSDQQPQISDVDVRLDLQKETEGLDLGWLPSFPHVLTASMANFLFGYHIGAQAHNLDEMLWGRFLVGLGIGANTVLVPLYISEVSPTKYRGSLGSLCQIGTCLGIIASLALGIPSESDPHWWRIMLYIACIPGFILIFGMQFAVESPRWLYKVGRVNETKKVIETIWGESEVEKSIEEIQTVINDDVKNQKTSWLELLVEPNKKGSLFILQQFAGINGVLYFSSLTFQDVGITSSSLASLLVGLTNFAGALFALTLMDNQGRRRLLIGSYLGMAISMFLIVYAITVPLDEGSSHILSILGTLMYIFTFALGAGPVTGIIIPELSSNQSRSKIMGFSFSVHWICNFLVGLYFLELVEKFGVGPVYGAFGGVSLMSAVFATYFIVETKGRSLEEIEISMNANLAAKDE
ncbi:Sugar transporter [Musa troglodytarum]|uniref:Sugar transporter n=1 Tax=Musa troglodytarum TaxID=320322 RepID=A0A9E7GUX3_9LILI|nr:Sugar transporter [Musa troglodytarum]